MKRRLRERVPPLQDERPVSRLSQSIEADRRRRKNPYVGSRDVIWAANQPSPPRVQEHVNLPDILTEAQIAHASRLYKAHGMDAVGRIQAEVIEPNMSAINEKLGQDNSARYVAYAIVYVFSEAEQT